MGIVTEAGRNWKGMMGLTGAFFAGTVFMGTLMGFIGLPEQHQTDIAALDARITPIERYIHNQDVLICIQTRQAVDETVESCLIK